MEGDLFGNVTFYFNFVNCHCKMLSMSFPDLVYARSGDRIWWTWFADEVDHMFQITEIEKCISPLAIRPAIENEAQGEDNSSSYISASSLTKLLSNLSLGLQVRAHTWMMSLSSSRWPVVWRLSNWAA